MNLDLAGFAEGRDCGVDVGHGGNLRIAGRAGKQGKRFGRVRLREAVTDYVFKGSNGIARV
ncbi:MAG TPA: hypothetical protein VG894_09645, partial [Bauldia sp.]|nr:hypothetical protein [Bauldia sp.]